MKLSPGGLLPPPKTFQHLIRKKDVIVFVDFRNGLSSLWFAALAGFLLQDEADSRTARLNLSGFLMERVGVCDQ
jgi:hypothetical protein